MDEYISGVEVLSDEQRTEQWKQGTCRDQEEFERYFGASYKTFLLYKTGARRPYCPLMPQKQNNSLCLLNPDFQIILLNLDFQTILLGLFLTHNLETSHLSHCSQISLLEVGRSASSPPILLPSTVAIHI